MKQIFILIFFLFSQVANANEIQLITLAKINNVPITNKDLTDEILVLKTINKNQTADKKLLQEIAFKGLINDAVMNIEIKKNGIISKEKNIQKIYNNFLSETKGKIIISSKIRKKILIKIKLQQDWNTLIVKKYFKKININVNEIESRIIDLGYTNLNDSKTIALKKKMVSNEKDKKLQLYSQKYLNEIKKKQLIKIF